MADNPITTPLPADLPENWSVGQIVAPSGTVAGLTEQHGYNYLMAQVNAAQEGVNAIGEAFEDLATLENGKVPNSQLPVGTPNGLATLGSTGKVPKSQLPIGGPGGLATLDDAGQIDAALIPIYPWQLIDLLDNTGAMSGTWTAPDVFEGENYDLGVYMIGGGGSGGAAINSGNNTATGGAAGYGKNFIINNVAPNTQYAYVIGAGGEPATAAANTAANGNAGGSASFNSVSVDGGNGGKASTTYVADGVDGGQGSDGMSYYYNNQWQSGEFPRDVFGCCEGTKMESNGNYIFKSGISQSPRVGQNAFDQNMVTLCAGGWACNNDTYKRTQSINPMPDGTKGGNGVIGASGENATGYGNGGGAGSRRSASGNVSSGSGSDGAIFLYARRRSPVEYQVSITVLDQDDNPVDGIAINGLYSNAEGSRNGLAVTGSNGVATGISYQQQATFTTDAYTDLTSGSVSLVMTEGSVTEGTINVVYTDYIRYSANTSGIKFSPAVKRIDVAVAGAGGGGGCGQSRYDPQDDYPFPDGSGGGDGYVTVQESVSFTPDTEYSCTVGVGGVGAKAGSVMTAAGNGTASSFLGVTANGGTGAGLWADGMNTSGAPGVGGSGIGGQGGYARRIGGEETKYPATKGANSSNQVYASINTMMTVGGCGSGGWGTVSTIDSPEQNSTVGLNGGTPYGGYGAKWRVAGGGSRYQAPGGAATGIAGGGGGGSREVNVNNAVGGAGGRGGNGIVTARIYHSHNLPAA